MKKHSFLIIILFFLYHNSSAISASAHKKYPYTLLTKDYGILKDSDLDTSKMGVKTANSFPKGNNQMSYIYWQCFPRDRISISLEDLGYTSKDIGGNDNYSGLRIMVSDDSTGYHEYVMRRRWPTSAYEDRFNLWLKLRKGQKYVCLEGSFFERKEIIKNGKKWLTSAWIFEKLKTKKGDSYFTGRCDSEKGENLNLGNYITGK